LENLGWHYDRCGVNQLEGTIPRHGQMSDHYGGVCFVKFGEKEALNAPKK